MIGTVEDATRWDCPRSMDVYGYPGGNCRGNKCAAWRWKYNRIEPGPYQAFVATYPTPKIAYERTDKGYCGAFGRPEAE